MALWIGKKITSTSQWWENSHCQTRLQGVKEQETHEYRPLFPETGQSMGRRSVKQWRGECRIKGKIFVDVCCYFPDGKGLHMLIGGGGNKGDGETIHENAPEEVGSRGEGCGAWAVFGRKNAQAGAFAGDLEVRS